MRITIFFVNMKFLIVFLLLSVVFCANGRIIKSHKRKPAQMKLLKYKVRNKTNHITKESITINLKIHGDKELIPYLNETGELKTKKLSYNIAILKKAIGKYAKTAEELLNHHTLGAKIKINVHSIKFMRNTSKLFEANDNVSVYLRNYCNWQALKKNGTNMYFSLLVSGVNFYNVEENGKRNYKSAGRTFGGSMCKVQSSCAIVKWRPKNLDYLIAHELAHSLDIRHDSPSFNNCKPNKNLMMSTTYDKRIKPRGWSACNRRDLMKFLKSRKSDCVRHRNKT